MALLEVKELRTSFHSRAGIVRAVDGVSFIVNEGETLGLVGESGCGKSVTALSVMRLVPEPPAQHSGRIEFEGQDVLAMDEAQVRRIRGNRVAMIFQDPSSSLNPVLTIERQLSEALRLHKGLDAAQARRRGIELLDMVGIADAAERIRQYPHQFSGGMRQRVMIAMALSCAPKLILADEITTALDVTIQAQVLDLLRNLAEEFDTAMILITHDLGIIAGISQRVHVMYAGQIVEKATTDELFANPKMPYTWGLLRSIPRLDERRRERLIPIEGLPPDLSDLPTGCRFTSRCQYRRPICQASNPELMVVPKAAPDHEARCWGTQDVPGGGWLIDSDWRREIGDEQTLDAIRLAAAESTTAGVDTALTATPAEPPEVS